MVSFFKEGAGLYQTRIARYISLGKQGAREKGSAASSRFVLTREIGQFQPTSTERSSGEIVGPV